MKKTPIQDSCGVPHETTIYDLTVFNQLAMVCIDNEKARRIQSVSDMTQIEIDDKNGRGHETTLYNLNVLNQLAMVCIDNPKYLRRFLCHKNLLYQI